MSSSDLLNENKAIANEDEDEFDADGRRVSFWSFFREAGNVPLQELMKREEEAEKKKDALPTSIGQTTTTERKAKGLSMKAPSFLFKKRTMKKTEKDVEEKEDN